MPSSLITPITGDPDFDRIIQETWTTLPAKARSLYITAAASLAVPVENLLLEALDHRLTKLERHYGLSPMGKGAYASDQLEGPKA